MKTNGLILLVAIAALVFGVWTKNQLSRQDPTLPTHLPDFSLPDLSGKSHDSSEWQNQILVINFWATWCPPCRKEIPDLTALHKEYAKLGLTVIGIAIDDPEAVTAYLSETPIAYPLLMGGDGGIDLARQLGNAVDAIPFTVITGRQGQIIDRHPGGLNKNDLLRIIAPLLKQ